MNKRIFILIFLDILLILFSFYLSTVFKGASFSNYFYSYLYSLLVFTGIWILTSLLYKKYSFTKHSSIEVSGNILKSNLVSVAIVTAIIFFSRNDYYSRFIVFSTILLITLSELFIYNLWVILKKTQVIPEDILGRVERSVRRDDNSVITNHSVDFNRYQSIQRAILSEFDKDVLNYLDNNTALFSDKTLIVATTTSFNILNQPDGNFDTIINLKRINDIRRINKFFESINLKLPKTGTFICLAETQELRKKRILKKYPPVLNRIYYFFDFFLKRVFPKFSLTTGLYFFLTRGENRVLSRAELLGRLYSCGFDVIDEREINKLHYVIAKKIRRPYFDLEPTYGPLIKLQRTGKGGKIIKVYKFRTMHPYSEYLQEFIYKKHNLQEGGKFKDDFRVSTLGKLMRKFWIDELPMFINLLRGDLKIVGVRPLSRHYFSLYSKELQERRIKYKPGLIPPFYVDKPKTIDEIMASEIKYFDLYDKHPLLTDIRYFFKAVFNIVFKNYRSN
ncbi:MAG: sugar transferase [Bacteroidales bacterium]